MKVKAVGVLGLPKPSIGLRDMDCSTSLHDTRDALQTAPVVALRRLRSPWQGPVVSGVHAQRTVHTMTDKQS